MHNINKIVVVRSFPGGDCEVPAEVLSEDERRCDVRYAHGNVENVGKGNVRPAADWQIASFWRMRDEQLRSGRYVAR